MLLYYITDRRQFPGSEADQRRALLNKIVEAARANIDFIQLRETDLPIRELEVLASKAVTVIRSESQTTRLLINSRIDVAMAIGADGVHLTSSDIAASEARAIWMYSGNPVNPIIGVSCHSAKDVDSAASHGADFAVLAPIFGKVATGAPGIGLRALREATGLVSKRDVRVEAGERRERIRVLALGGVTAANARHCIEAGAVGIAGIRLFQQENIASFRSALARVTQSPSAEE